MNIPVQQLSPAEPAMPALWEVHPWGRSFRLLEQDRFSVRHLIIEAEKSIHLECHLHRNEHWLIVSGAGRVQRGNAEFDLFEGDSLDIGIGETHRIANLGRMDLHMIEVRMGCYLADDDLVEGLPS